MSVTHRPGARLRHAAGLSALVLTLSLVPAGLAADASVITGNPDPRAPENIAPAQRQALTEQVPFIELDTKVRELAAATGNSPLAGTSIDRPHRTLDVYWSGSVPAEELYKLSAEAAQRRLTLKVHRAAFSEKQLMAASRRLSEHYTSSRAPMGVELHVDGSGLTVHSEGLASAAGGRVARTERQARLLEVIDTVRAETGVPISVVDGAPNQHLSTRSDDRSPHWGGAVTHSGGLACTSAFSTYATGAPSMRHMLTAAHCSQFRDGQLVTNGAGVRMGTTDFIAEMYDQQPRYDTGVIRLDAGLTNEPKVYSTETTYNPYRVIGFHQQGIPAGLVFCVSGAVSVPSCNLRSGGQYEACPVGVPHCFLVIRVTSTDGRTIFCQGDSGGPVYSWNSNWTGIYAAGMVSVGDTERCATAGGISVVATAVSRIPGLWVLT